MKRLYKLMFAILLTIIVIVPSYGQTYNYAEVLQKSMFFYEAQRSGVLPASNRVTWRGNAAVHDGSDVGKDLSGGWFDAGDHIKFNFPMAYSVTTLCWGALEFSEGYTSSSQLSYLKGNIKFVTDYLIKCHTAPHEFYGQLGDATDHNYWVPAEMIENSYARKSYKITESGPGSDLAGEAVAALAAASILFKDSDPSYSATLLSHAKQLYEFADLFRGKYSDVITAANNFYTSWSGYQDELCWGAIWLYLATNDNTYLTKARAEYDKLSNEGQTTLKSYGWTLAWDDKSYGCYVLMSKITGEQKYKDDSERWLNQWFTTRTESIGPNFTGSGFPILSEWGTFRYAANTAFCMQVYAKYAGDATKATKYKDRAKSIIDYLLGNNPQKTSYVIGFGSKYPMYPHHRTAHGSWCRDENKPAETRHTLYGALVGGHKTNNDLNWTDDRHDYYWNEVATDYNSCFTGAIAALTKEFGGTPIASFPVAETPKDEFVVEAKINSSGNTYTEYSVWVDNHTAWPARIPSQWKYRLFVDITEGLAAGYKVSDYIVSSNNSTVTFTGLTAWDAAKNIYYTEVTYNSGILIWPGGQGESTEESQIRIRLPYEAPASSWNPANDYSYTGMTSTLAQTNYIPLYADGKLVAGKEPGPSVTYTITASAGTGGTITPSGSVSVTQGVNQPFAIAANTGYKISEVTVDGTSVGAVATYTFTNVTANHTITASFVAVPTYTINATAGTGGTIAPSGSVSVTQGANQSFAIAANTGYKISDVAVDATSVDAVATYTFTNVTANHTIAASFVTVPTYTINATAGTGGTITPSGSVSVTQGANQSFAIAANAGYKVNDITVDGISVGAVTTYAFTNVTANHTIAASFAVDTNSCNLLTKYAVPRSSALPTIANSSFSHSYTLGTGGPTLSNVTVFTINWDLPNKGLWQFSMNTNNGIPSWWLDLLPKISQTFASASPACTLTGTGIAGLDGDYWVNMDGTNFVMVAKSGAYALYFTNGAAPTGCPVKSAQEVANTGLADALFSVFPNPADKDASISVNLQDQVNGASFVIIDMSGRSVLNGTLTSTTNRIALNGKLNSGIYLIKIVSGKEQFNKILIVK